MKDNKYLTLREFKDIKERFQNCIARQEKLLTRCLSFLDLLEDNFFLCCSITRLKDDIQDELKRDFL